MTAEETMLIVDDARLARKMVRSFVATTRPGMTIFEAADGKEAIKILEDMPSLSFATIDYNMPGMNGLDLAMIIKERLPSTRIVLLTANVQAPLRRRAADIGIDFIDKPVTEVKLSAFFNRAAPRAADQR
ncbi:MAG: response regulator [Rhodospirillaceae bacterium]